MISISLIQQAYDAGLCVVPPAQDGSKKPFPPGSQGLWKQYQQQRPSLALLSQWYDPIHNLTGIGLVCGKASGNVEVLDFDTVDGWQEYREMAEHCGIAPLIQKIWVGYGEETPRGAHLIYRCAEIAGNTPLAKDPATKKAFIETRGEGGYIIIAPSNGGVHPTGAEYRCVSGSISTIVEISPEERRDLWELAKSLCRMPRTLDMQAEPLQSSNDPSNKPGADFNARASWSDVLVPHGWKAIYQKGDVTYWRRPGKNQGISASTGYDGTAYLYVFTTSTELDAKRAYTKFGAYGVLNHGGDFRAATATLGRSGYGEAPRAPDHSQRPRLYIVPPTPQAAPPELGEADDAPVWKNDADESDDDLPPESLAVPFGVGPALVDYLLATSLHPNRVFAVQTARSFIGAVLSRRHVSSMRNYANLYAIVIGKTASGKEDAKHQIENLLTACGLDRMIVGKGYSHPSAIYTALQDEPKHITLIDEMGMYLREQKNPTSIINLLIREFMELFGRAHGLHHAPRLSGLGLSKADRDQAKAGRSPVIKPGLNLLAMSTPETLWASMSREHLDSGFLNRFLMVESRTPRQVIQEFKETPVPASIISWVNEATGKANPLLYSNQFVFDLEPHLVTWTLTADAYTAMRAFEQRMLDEANEWDIRLPGLGTLPLRANEISLRVGLQNAVLDYRRDRMLTADHLINAQIYVEAHLRRGADSIYRGMVASVFEGHRNVVLESLRKAGKEGVTSREMGRKPPFTRFTAKELTELLESLEAGWLITKLNVRHNQPGKKREAWVALDPNETAQYCREEDC